MKSQQLTVIFWNVWAYTQDGHVDNVSKLLTKLNELITRHNPDVFGLNEVIITKHNHSSAVIELLKTKKYSCHFTLISPTDEKWLVGNLIATKSKPIKMHEHILGPDTQAARRGYDGYRVKATEVELEIHNVTVTIVLIYLCSLLPLDWLTHIAHRKHYENVIKNIKNKNIIIGGDFNETKFMLPWFKLPKHLKRKTGSLFNPTWRLNGKVKHIVFANYDNLIYSEESQLRLKQFKVLNRWPSDHSPLLSVFTLSDRGVTGES